MRRELGCHIVIDPEIHHGEITFRGTRIPIAFVLEDGGRVGAPTASRARIHVARLAERWPHCLTASRAVRILGDVAGTTTCVTGIRVTE